MLTERKKKKKKEKCKKTTLLMQSKKNYPSNQKKKKKKKKDTLSPSRDCKSENNSKFNQKIDSIPNVELVSMTTPLIKLLFYRSIKILNVIFLKMAE